MVHLVMILHFQQLHLQVVEEVYQHNKKVNLEDQEVDLELLIQVKLVDQGIHLQQILHKEIMVELHHQVIQVEQVAEVEQLPLGKMVQEMMLEMVELEHQIVLQVVQ